MNQQRRHIFSLHDLLVMAALAALGGVSGSAISWIGAFLHRFTGIPGGLQFMAGAHVLWLVLAVGLIRKPGTAAITGLLKGAVELLSGNPHGLLVLFLSALGGCVVDLVWLLAGRRDHLVTYMLAGGLGAASNLLVLKIIYSLPSNHAVHVGLTILTGVAFVSGVLLAGLLGWSLMHALRRAGVAGAQAQSPAKPTSARAWLGMGAVGLVTVAIGTAVYFSDAGQEAEAREAPTTAQTVSLDPAAGL